VRGCSFSITGYTSREAALKTWNTRPLEDALRAENASLLAALVETSGRACDLEAEVKDLRGELEHLRAEREREPGNDMLKVLHACSVSAYVEVKAERDELLNMLEEVTWQAAGMGDRVSSWNISAYEDAIEMLKEYKRLAQSPIEHQYIRAVKPSST
jgi:hypothetical protein